MQRKSPSFRILKRGQKYAVWSDSPAAAVTQGIAMEGLDLADVRKIVAGLKKHGKRVDDKEAK